MTTTKDKIFIISKVKKQNHWSKSEDAHLLGLVEKFNRKNWNVISHFFEDKSSSQCYAR